MHEFMSHALARPFRLAATLAAETINLSTTAGQLAVASSLTIGYRLPRFVEAAFGSSAAQHEVRQAVSEKFAALNEAQREVALAMVHLSLAMAPGVGQTVRVRKAAAVARAALEPATRRAHANARRLGSRKARG